MISVQLVEKKDVYSGEPCAAAFVVEMAEDGSLRMITVNGAKDVSDVDAAVRSLAQAMAECAGYLARQGTKQEREELRIRLGQEYTRHIVEYTRADVDRYIASIEEDEEEDEDE